MQTPKLFIPGPIELRPDVLAEMAQPCVAHYGTEWVRFYRATMALLAGVYGTSGDVFAMPGSGSAGIDAALSSSIAPGDCVLVVESGFFGARLAEIARVYTENVVRLRVARDAEVTGEILKSAIERTGAAVVAAVHCETSNGTLNPVQAFGSVCAEMGSLFIVDAVSSLGIEQVAMDEWNIGVCIAASQKGLEAPPGIALVAVGPSAWQRIESIRKRSWYLSLRTWREYEARWHDWHPHPVTQAVNLLKALHVSLLHIRQEGIVVRVARHAASTGTLRDGLRAEAFDLEAVDATASHGVTAIRLPDGMPRKVVEYMRTAHGMQIAGGLGGDAATMVRVALIGPHAQPDTARCVAEALIDARRQLG